MIPSRTPSSREKRHRLPRECYHGEVTVANTACVEAGYPLFTDAEIVKIFLERLERATKKHQCIVYIYCFMPEHQHLILHGTTPTADTWRAIVDYKQLTGYWLGRERPKIEWQKDFYDHIIHVGEDLGSQIRYVANNPVRRKLVTNWEDYPYTGALGIDFKTVMADTATL